jgi:hypothetical protein
MLDIRACRSCATVSAEAISVVIGLTDPGDASSMSNSSPRQASSEADAAVAGAF